MAETEHKAVIFIFPYEDFLILHFGTFNIQVKKKIKNIKILSK